MFGSFVRVSAAIILLCWIGGRVSVAEEATKGGTAVSAADLAKAFLDDPKAATKTYANKRLVVTGKVTAVQPERFILTLEGTKKGEKAMDVECWLGMTNFEAAKNIKVDQTVTINGTLSSAEAGSVVLGECSLATK